LIDQGQDAALVLVVDDVCEIVEELVVLLGLAEMPAVGAHSLATAIDALEAAPTIGVVVCDVRLHRESGLEIIERVAAHARLAHRALHYIFMTGDPMRSDAIAPLHCRLLTKPVRPSDLIQLVQSLLGRAGRGG